MHAPGHAHHHHGHRALKICFGITFVFFLLELCAALYTQSLALLSDAMHMCTDVLALGISMAALRLANVPADHNHSFGHQRIGILSAIFNSVLLFFIALWMIYEGVERYFSPVEPNTQVAFWVAVAGVLANVTCLSILRPHRHEGMNLKAAYLEVTADTLSSVGVLCAIAFMYMTGKNWLDGLVAIGIGFWALPRAWSLFKECAHILMEGVPEHISMDAIAQQLLMIEGVLGIHDLHIWGLDQKSLSLTAHVVHNDTCLPAQMMPNMQKALAELGITHTTFQFEYEACAHSDGKYWGQKPAV